MPHTIRINTRAIIGNAIVNAGELVSGDDQFVNGLRQAGVSFSIVDETSSGKETTDNEAIGEDGEPFTQPKNDRRHGAKPPLVHG